MSIRNLSLNKRLYLILGTLISLIFSIGEWSLWQSYQINKRVGNIYTQELVPLENLSKLKGAIYRIRDRSLQLVNAKTIDDIKYHKQIINNQILRIFKGIDKYDDTRLSAEEKNELKNFKTNLKQYISILKSKIYKNLLKKPENFLENILYKHALIYFKEARESLNKLSKYQIDRAKLRYKHSNDILNTQFIIVQMILFIILSISIYFSKVVISSIMIPIKQINEVLSKISREDFSQKLRVNSKDEFGELSKMLNKNIKKLENTFRELQALTNFDTLTNLPNRKLFNEKLSSAISSKKHSDRNFAVMFLDIDNFKFVNDTFGHSTGDKLLEVIAKRISVFIRQNDTLARFGGDEFALLIENVENPVVVGNIANKIIDSIQKPIYINNHMIFVGASIGIYVSNGSIDSKDEILAFADIAMYEAKKNGKGRYVYFDQQMHEQLKDGVILENNLREAIKNNELEVYYQPIIESHSEVPYGVETLLRWKKDGQIISPEKFIPKLESSGLIIETTYQLIENVFKMIEKYDYKNIVSINLSILQFHDENFIPFLKRMLTKYPKVNPGKVFFEITETIFAQNSDIIYSTMDMIKKIGFHFSLDDFGTGYSSLSYIKDYPIKTIKIDKLFIDNIIEDDKSLELLDGIVYLANILHMTVIVEGVEDKTTLNLLKKIDKNIKIQGYYYYKPMNQKEFEALL